jgi:uncharacterized protein (DUF952 family)
MYIYHIVLPEDWEIWKERSFYEAPSLITEGFIHCSFEEQLNSVIDRYYSNVADIVILKIESDKLTSKLIAEPSTAEELYPHVYGPIDLDAVIGAERRSNPSLVTVDA